MAKKIISIVLSVIFAFSAFAICSFAGDTITDEDRELYPAEELAIADPKDRIDRALLTGKRFGMIETLADTAASKDVLEDNLYYWKQEIIDEYHALEAKGDAATDAEWGALYRKMKTPKDNDFDSYRDFWYEYKDLSKGKATVKYVASKDVVEPGEEFTVDMYLTTDFWFSFMYATVFYDNTVIDIVGCNEDTREKDVDVVKPDDPSTVCVHPLGEAFSTYWEYNEGKHYGDYDLKVYGDMRSMEWPEGVKAEENCYDRIEGYRFSLAPKLTVASTPAMKCDNTKVITLRFKAKETATAGSMSKIFCTNDAMYTYNKLAYYDECEAIGKTIAPCWQFYRVDKDSDACLCYLADESYQFDKTLDITGTAVTIAGAQVEKADYTALDAAIAAFDSSVSGLYTASSWSAYASAVTAGSALSRDLTKDEQATVDAATKAITDAKDALVLNALVSADVIGTPTIGSNANVKIVANGSPKAIRLVGEGDNALTFNREDAVISVDGDNEVWNIKVAATSAKAEYAVFAKYGDEFAGEALPLVIEATEGLDLSIHSISIPDMYPAGTYMDGKIYSGSHDVIVRTSKDVFKFQLIDEDGNTRTFDQKVWTPVEDGDELVWTVKVNFNLGKLNLGFRTRAYNTTFALTGDYITGRVVF